MKHIAKTLSLTAALLFFIVNAFSQGETNSWYFGNNAGVSFQTGSPVSVSGGQVNTTEGCATISDNAGNLLFYTDGITVWNRNHLQMPNGFGLLGDPSSTQSGIIVKKPGSTTIYYVFTTAAEGNTDGFRWSEVDMSLAAGLGDVTVNKNILLYTPTAEKICGIKHCNNTDVWVVSHALGNTNQFKAYLVTSIGINSVAVNSNAGTVYSTGGNTIGYMKISPDGRKLACAVRYTTAGVQPGYCELFDFDNSTGIVSNPLVIPSVNYAYGVEFSRDSKLFYLNMSVPGAVFQLNLCAGTAAEILASQIQVGSSTTGFLGSLQMGSDNKIYMSRWGTTWLAVINSPDVLGVGCNYVDDGVPISFGVCAGGLPNFVTTYLRLPPLIVNNIDTIGNCLLDSLSFSSPTTQTGCSPIMSSVISVAWNFGDPVSGVNNISTLSAPIHIFSTSGTYHVLLVVNYACYSDSILADVSIQSCGVHVQMTASTALCEGTCTDITAIPQGGTPPYSYSWTPNIGSGAGPFTVCPSSSTVYTVSIIDAAGTSDIANDTITVNSSPPAVLSPGGTLAICNGSGISLNANSGDYNYTWYHDGVIVQNGSSSGYFANSPGIYQVQVTDMNSGCSSVSQAVTIVLGGGPVATIVTPGGCEGILFNGGSVTLTCSATNAASYLWSPGGQTTSSIQVTQTGTYCVTAFDASGCPSDAAACNTVNSLNVQCGQNGQKVILCHVPPGNPGNPQTLCIAPGAVPAHLANHPGDCLGPCNLYYPRLSSNEIKDDMDYSFYIDAYPNPFKSTFSLEIINSSSDPVNLSIYDTLGRIVERYNDSNEKTLIGDHLKEGIYFMVAQQGDNINRLRVVKE